MDFLTTSRKSMPQYFALNVESGLDHTFKDEMVHNFFLSFRDGELENSYRMYQFEIARSRLLGRFGSLSLLSMITGIVLIMRVLQFLLLCWRDCVISHILRLLSVLPLTLSCLHHQVVLQRGGYLTLDALRCNQFITRHVILLCGVEVAMSFVNDYFPGVEDCTVDRFACPHTFSSPKFLTRSIIGAAILVFNLTLWIPFSQVAALLFVHCALSRIHGFFFFPTHMDVSLWAFGCASLQIAIFLLVRYQHEVQARKGYLLQLHILQLRANLQRLLDHMLPRAISDRLRPGEHGVHRYGALRPCRAAAAPAQHPPRASQTGVAAAARSG